MLKLHINIKIYVIILVYYIYTPYISSMFNQLTYIDMISTRLHTALRTVNRPFISFHANANTSEGWKLSIQGKTVEDAIYLLDALKDFLFESNVPFKMGTQNLIDRKSEQSTKLMTIYVPNGVDVKQLAEAVYSRTLDYKGWYDIKTKLGYQHYAGGVFFRNDRDVNGTYIPAKIA
jgi:hypothetical protein